TRNSIGCLMRQQRSPLHKLPAGSWLLTALEYFSGNVRQPVDTLRTVAKVSGLFRREHRLPSIRLDQCGNNNFSKPVVAYVRHARLPDAVQSMRTTWSTPVGRACRCRSGCESSDPVNTIRQLAVNNLS